MPAATKTRRIEARATARQEDLIRRAAALSDVTMSEFILATAVSRAEDVLAERSWFTASADEYEEFLDRLDSPWPDTGKFQELMARRAEWASGPS
ncbi:MAG: DUF1778 domain-containing protein [Propionibacteriaceae bacterium]|jgi:uncharacterized protein (DUF1778 family)|nr:DUF1778 domain-containing protein [Propionibacteriaceae bacterium]